MSPRNLWNIENLKDLPIQMKQLSELLKDFYTILTNGFTFGDNFKGTIVDFEFTSANAQSSISHGLNFIPKYYVVIKSNAALSVYNTKAPDASNIYLFSTATGKVSILIF